MTDRHNGRKADFVFTTDTLRPSMTQIDTKKDIERHKKTQKRHRKTQKRHRKTQKKTPKDTKKNPEERHNIDTDKISTPPPPYCSTRPRRPFLFLLSTQTVNSLPCRGPEEIVHEIFLGWLRGRGRLRRVAASLLISLLTYIYLSSTSFQFWNKKNKQK